MTDVNLPPGYYRARGRQVGALSEEANAMARAYRDAELVLRAELQRIAEILLQDPDSTKRYRAEQIQGMLRRISTMRAELDGQARIFTAVDDEMAPLSRIYADGRVRGALAAGATAPGQGSMTLIHRQALDVLAQDTFDDLAAATSYMEENAKRVIREATKARSLLGTAAGTSVERDALRLTQTLQRRGVSAFVDRAGRRWRLGVYAEMVVRTKSAQAYNSGTILQGEEDGTSIVQIVDGERSGHEACLAYSGKYATAAWALAHPIEHPNCVRAFSPAPLFTGVPHFGDASRPSARQMVEDAHALREGRGVRR